MDFSKTSLKAGMLHGGSELPSVPDGHRVHMNKPHENIKQLLRCTLRLTLFGDSKVAALCLDLRVGTDITVYFHVNGLSCKK